jgi:RNA polymerase subunit RPABC4/transcription elongation factor Spt4
MNCGACGELIPADSMFCPECGSRQDTSVAGGFAPPAAQNIPPFPQQQRTFDPVSGQQQRMQQEANMSQMGSVAPDMLQSMAQGIHQHQNLPPGAYPQQPIPGGFPPQQPLQGGFPPQQTQGNFPPQTAMPPAGNVAPLNDMPNVNRGPSIASGAIPNVSNVSPLSAGGTKIAHNPANSPTDAMVNRLAEAERAVKDERRNQWLSMNQSPASSVLANLGGGELPAHLRHTNVDGSNAAAEIMAGTMGGQTKDTPNDALLRRISEVAIRRVARKRGVAVEAPQTKLNGDVFEVNVTYVDDGRVLDSPEDLTQAFEQAIQTELALKGYDLSCNITMFRSKDGKTEKIGEGEEEDMFACEICDGLVKDSDPTCPHCGAMFEDEEAEDEAEPASSRSGPPGPSKSGGPPGPKKGGPPGPSKSGGPPGPKKGGPPGPSKSGGPPGPSKSGGPPGPSKSGGPPGPSKSGGPPGPSKSGGPPKGGPGGGPPGGPKKGGPPGPSKSGGPPGPSKSGGPPKGGPGGGPPGPKKGGPPGGPKRGPPGR